MTASSPLVEADRCDSLPRDADGRREQLLVGLFCLLAGLRVLVYAAAFPFFNNVDEYDHFDTVCKYAQGHVPRGLEQWSDEAATFIALYGSPEFIGRFEDFPGGKIPSPVWTCSPEEAARAFERIRNEWRHQRNFEAVQPPAYYVVAGAWFDLGKLIGIRGGDLLYWTRIVSVLAYVLLVWLAYLLAKELFPQDKFLYLGVPAVLAVLAQTIYYGLDNDVLSGPLGTLVLYLLVRFYRSPSPSGQLAWRQGWPRRRRS